MLCPPNIVNLETVVHFEQDLKKNIALKVFTEKAAAFLKSTFMGTRFFFQF
jgi:hypothetical protein